MVPYYNVFGCGGGQWDGYLDAKGAYKALTPAIRAALPTPPGFWTSASRDPKKFWVEWLDRRGVYLHLRLPARRGREGTGG